MSWSLVRYAYNPHRIFLKGTCHYIQEKKTGARRGESPRWTGFDEQEVKDLKLMASAPELREALERIASEPIDSKAAMREIARAALNLQKEITDARA